MGAAALAHARAHAEWYAVDFGPEAEHICREREARTKEAHPFRARLRDDPLKELSREPLPTNIRARRDAYDTPALESTSALCATVEDQICGEEMSTYARAPLIEPAHDLFTEPSLLGDQGDDERAGC